MDKATGYAFSSLEREHLQRGDVAAASGVLWDYAAAVPAWNTDRAAQIMERFDPRDAAGGSGDASTNDEEALRLQREVEFAAGAIEPGWADAAGRAGSLGDAGPRMVIGAASLAAASARGRGGARPAGAPPPPAGGAEPAEELELAGDAIRLVRARGSEVRESMLR